MSTPIDPQLKRQQAYNLWWAGRRPLESVVEANRFLQSVQMALRYNVTANLPLAGMHKAAGDVRKSTELSNALLASGEAIETNTIAERLVLLHRSIAPAVYVLRRRDIPIHLSPTADRAFGFIQQEGHASSGEVRRFLGVYGLKRPDPGDIALAELQRQFLIDRGPSSVPKSGIPYLSPEGYPYRIFDKANADVVRSAAKLSVKQAMQALIEAYLQVAVFVTPRKLSSMFRLLISELELESITSPHIEKSGKLWIWSSFRSPTGM
jgi:hypothetical protein